MFTFKDLGISSGDIIIRRCNNKYEKDDYYLVVSINEAAGSIKSGCQVSVVALGRCKKDSFYWETAEFARRIFALRSSNLPYLELLRLRDS